MPAANDIRKGQVIKFNGEPHLVMETQHRTPESSRLRAGEDAQPALWQNHGSALRLDRVDGSDPTDRRTLEFSYADRDPSPSSIPTTFDQIS